jgi:hypothetical protein
VTKIWTLWYAVTTETHPKGTHFAKMEVVVDPPLGVQSFMIVTFPLGSIPNDLR